MVRRTRKAGVLTAVDTRGPALAAILGLGVDVIKPNRAEAAEVLGMRLARRADVKKALRIFHGYGIKKVLISLGRDGVAAFDGTREVWGRTPVVRGGHTVGCGDAALAAFVAGCLDGDDLEGCAMRAAQSGAANIRR
jgi:fructose-1-phosphate kinase PfkB-like protein